MLTIIKFGVAINIISRKRKKIFLYVYFEGNKQKKQIKPPEVMKEIY